MSECGAGVSRKQGYEAIAQLRKNCVASSEGDQRERVFKAELSAWNATCSFNETREIGVWTDDEGASFEESAKAG